MNGPANTDLNYHKMELNDLDRDSGSAQELDDIKGYERQHTKRGDPPGEQQGSRILGRKTRNKDERTP